MTTPEHTPVIIEREGGVGELDPVAPSPGPSGYPGGKEPPSVLVLTKNEEVNIEACLETLSFSDDIVVLDSYSTDRTIELARKHPHVRIVRRRFDTWSQHSNWALQHIRFKHPWVYYSDADERVTPELREEILERINDPSRPEVAYRLKYKNMFLGRWIRRGGLYPVWIIRLYRPDRIRYEDREVNAHPIVDGPLGSLQHDFIHYSFNKGLLPWFTKHNSYSDMESKEAMRVIGSSTVWSKLAGMFSRQPGAARRALKDLSFFLPFRAFARFFYMYLLRGAFLDGRAGFHYACMISVYEYWIELKIRERQRSWNERNERIVARLLGGASTPLPPGAGAPGENGVVAAPGVATSSPGAGGPGGVP
jgi:glycosyltransferase involved in cell wall biosynthesis